MRVINLDYIQEGLRTNLFTRGVNYLSRHFKRGLYQSLWDPLIISDFFINHEMRDNNEKT
jgi:hypothetical protein